MARLEEHLPLRVAPVGADTVEDVAVRSDLGRLPWTAFVIITVMVVVMLAAFAVVFIAAVIDVVYAFLDPRIRLA